MQTFSLPRSSALTIHEVDTIEFVLSRSGLYLDETTYTLANGTRRFTWQLLRSDIITSVTLRIGEVPDIHDDEDDDDDYQDDEEGE